MNDLPSLRALHYFKQAAQFESFSSAADSLNVTHSAVSHQIKNLEGWLGTVLFNRTAGRVYLTADGVRLKACCDQVFSEIEKTCHQMRHRREHHLTIACSASFLAQWLLPRISRFSLQHPQITLSFQTQTDISLLTNQRADVLIKSDHHLTHEEFVATLIGSDFIGPVCAPGVCGTLSSPPDFTSLPLLHARTKINAWQEWANVTGARGDFSAGKHLDNLMLAIQAAKTGLGFSMTPKMLVKKELAEGSLLAPAGFCKADRATAMLVSHLRRDEPEIRVFRDWIQEEAETEQ
ncbi:LysR family transcriptional regulator [Rahnella victoriana]|uniref:LysR substrate-binding domain-containing protein n=1 Tax=Rahnella victoriana TaxID=1510570 RepID=UPI000BB1D889|nr:LysR substrate-binding domain-containing protein [Rahnella victoriana]PBI82181.1 LysR family transcriptional regulator [Rahnella victoriana]